jgi:hypothetical protein
VRARVPTVIGVAPSGPMTPSVPVPPIAAADDEVMELDMDEAGLVEAVSSQPPPPDIEIEIETDADSAPDVATEDDIQVQVTSLRPDSDIDNLSWSEPPAPEPRVPDSSRRARVAASLDEALADAADDSRIPIKTPPPESGRQPAEGVYAATLPTEAGERSVPTVEQLGDTLELGEPTSAELELDLRRSDHGTVKEALELELPPRPSVLEPPDEQRAPHRAPEESQVVLMPDEADTSVKSGVAPLRGDDTLLSGSEHLLAAPEVTRRPSLAPTDAVNVLSVTRTFTPQSFLELLDASLKLRE